MDTSLKARMAPHLGLLTIAGILERLGHEVVLQNGNLRKISIPGDADLVGVTVTVDVLPQAIDLARECRARGIPVVAGGIGVTCDPASAAPHFDAVCLGAAEGFCYNSVKGVRGGYRHRTVASVLEEIRSKKTRHVMFIDDNFIGDLGFVRELVEAMAPMGLTWNAAVSANIINHPDLLDRMRETGCRSLFVGFESMNADSIAGVHKGQNDVARYEQLVEMLHEREIMVNASFVFGLDSDDASVFRATLDWIVRNCIETVTSHILTPYPGTALHARLKEEGRLTDTNLSHYGMFNLLYRKYGCVTEALGKVIGFDRVG